jgi:hypothetical protein
VIFYLGCRIWNLEPRTLNLGHGIRHQKSGIRDLWSVIGDLGSAILVLEFRNWDLKPGIRDCKFGILDPRSGNQHSDPVCRMSDAGCRYPGSVSRGLGSEV